jgi:hypothetical protein
LACIHVQVRSAAKTGGKALKTSFSLSQSLTGTAWLKFTGSEAAQRF